MYETNIYLDQTDKKLLIKQAQKKLVSLSTLINIIVNNYSIILWETKNYIKKGNSQTHIKLKNERKLELTPIIIANCIQLYLNNSILDPRINTKNINKKIQSELDKTTDPSYMKNLLIRSTYNLTFKRIQK